MRSHGQLLAFFAVVGFPVLPLLAQVAPAAAPASPPQAVAAAQALQHPRPAPQSGGYSWTSGDYAYDGAGNVISIGDQAFGYDALSRLTYAHVTVPPTGWTEQSFNYDVYGNQTLRSTNTPATVNVDTGTNHLMDGNPTYDAAGNLTQWQPNSSHTYHFTYDGLNMVTEERVDNETSHMAYVYTADDERIVIDNRVTGVSHWKIRGLDEKVLRDFQLSGTAWSVYRDYVYRGGQMLAAITPTGEEHFSLDHLGTPRLITDQNKYKVALHTYLPFGEEIGPVPQDGEALKFTGHERDGDPSGGNDGLDYMHARYYASTIGRFLSVDPELNLKSTLGNPQKWNRYAYVRNNPISFTDPDGRDDLFIGDDFTDPFGRTPARADVGPLVKSLLHVDEMKEAFSGFSSAPLKEKLMAGAVGLISGLDIVGNFLEPEKGPITKGGAVMLGHFPEYLEAGAKANARVFNIPGAIWNKMSDAARWTANQKFLDRAIARGASLLLATDPAKIKAGSYLAKEVTYLLGKGFKLIKDTDDLWRFVPK
jgi:RHS repeat-associated protein